MQRIAPFLWFNDQAEEAVNFYTSVFKNSKVMDIVRYNGEGAKVAVRPKGSIMTIHFQIEGQELLQDKEVRKSEAVMRAMLQMGKLDIRGLKQAYE